MLVFHSKPVYIHYYTCDLDLFILKGGKTFIQEIGIIEVEKDKREMVHTVVQQLWWPSSVRFDVNIRTFILTLMLNYLSPKLCCPAHNQFVVRVCMPRSVKPIFRKQTGFYVHRFSFLVSNTLSPSGKKNNSRSITYLMQQNIFIHPKSAYFRYFLKLYTFYIGSDRSLSLF